MPSVSRNVLLAIATSLSIGACAASAKQTRDPKVVRYNQQVLALTGTPVAQAQLFGATKKLLIEREYKIVDEDANLGYLEVCSPVDSSFGMQTREHWMVFVSAKEVSVEKSLQERVKGDWLEYGFVDRSYSYASENELLSSIAGAATQIASTGQGGSGGELAAKRAAAK